MVRETGTVNGMTKSKVTISVDPERLEQARELSGANTSATVDAALRRFIAFERARLDLAAYRRAPQTDDDVAGGEDWADYSDLADDTDWEKLYKEKR